MTVNSLKKIISRSSDFADTDSDMTKSASILTSNQNITHGEKEVINLEILRQLIPLRNLNDDELTAFSVGRYAENVPASVKLFVEDTPIDSVLYLLAGTIRIESNSGRGYEVSAGSAQSRFPLSSGVMHTTTATAVTSVTVLRVPSKVMTNSQETVDSEIMGEPVELRMIPTELEDSQLFQALYQNYTEEELALAILPTVAEMVTRAFSRDINKNQAARIIESDAVITAKLVSVANSPLFHGSGGVYTALDAVNVLGMEAVRYVVNNACKNYALHSSNRPYVEQVQRACAQSLLVSGLCYAVASLTEAVDPKQALTAGLLSNIGVMPFAHYVDKFPSQLYNQDEIEMGWPIVRGFMGTFVLEELGLPEQLSSIPLLSDNWMYDSGKDMDLVDIVIISRLLVHMDELGVDSLPQFEKIPSVKKIGGKGLTPELSKMLHQIALKRIKRPLAVVKQSLKLPKQIK